MQNSETNELDENLNTTSDVKMDEPIIDDALRQKIATIVNLALKKISFAKNKEKACETLNQLLLPLQYSLEKKSEDENSFQLKGENFQVDSSWNQIEGSNHPIYLSFLPVLKRISKLN